MNTIEKTLIVIAGLLIILSCDSNPDTIDEDSEPKEQVVNEEASPETLDVINSEAAILAMADISKDDNKEFSGKAYFTQHMDKIILTTILTNAEPGTYSVHLMKNADCNSAKNTDSQFKSLVIKAYVGEVVALIDGTAQEELNLENFANKDAEELSNYNILIVTENQKIFACGEVKKYEKTNR